MIKKELTFEEKHPRQGRPGVTDDEKEAGIIEKTVIHRGQQRTIRGTPEEIAESIRAMEEGQPEAPVKKAKKSKKAEPTSADSTPTDGGGQ